MITGFPRIGENRELKKALENYWSNKSSFKELEKAAQELRKKHWLEQKNKGIDFISSNDFSYYDNMLDTAVMLNVIPERFRNVVDDAERYFAMARGNTTAVAMEMTKWFNTNYHYIVPELGDNIKFQLNPDKIVKEYQEAKELGIKTKINIVGPITFIGLSKTTNGKNPFDYFDKALSVYKELLLKLEKLDDSILVQFDEPILVKNPTEKQLSLVRSTYKELPLISKNVKIIVNTYFEHACEAVKELADTSVWGIGLDFVHGSRNLDSLSSIGSKKLIAGIVDGRNIWLNNFDKSLELLNKISEKVSKEQIIISTSCSLLHVPYSLKNEPESAIKQWLAFAVEKVEEVAFIGRIFHEDSISDEDRIRLEQNRKISKDKSTSKIITNQMVDSTFRFIF
jgi:5-methyltetrahydropteroyltriglutamate--homocysteine methyltransferase